MATDIKELFEKADIRTMKKDIKKLKEFGIGKKISETKNKKDVGKNDGPIDKIKELQPINNQEPSTFLKFHKEKEIIKEERLETQKNELGPNLKKDIREQNSAQTKEEKSNLNPDRDKGVFGELQKRQTLLEVNESLDKYKKNASLAGQASNGAKEMPLADKGVYGTVPSKEKLETPTKIKEEQRKSFMEDVEQWSKENK